jgi:hypothetical protein
MLQFDKILLLFFSFFTSPFIFLLSFHFILPTSHFSFLFPFYPAISITPCALGLFPLLEFSTYFRFFFPFSTSFLLRALKNFHLINFRFHNYKTGLWKRYTLSKLFYVNTLVIFGKLVRCYCFSTFRFEGGRIIIRQGHQAECFYFILSGIGEFVFQRLYILYGN